LSNASAVAATAASDVGVDDDNHASEFSRVDDVTLPRDPSFADAVAAAGCDGGTAAAAAAAGSLIIHHDSIIVTCLLPHAATDVTSLPLQDLCVDDALFGT
jgi:hypothetical protein